MALDGIILFKLNQQLQSLKNGKINKIYQLSKTELVFYLRQPQTNLVLLISTHAVANRIQLTTQKYDLPAQPNNFVMLLRKHLENGLITELKQVNYDRYLIITIKNRNTLGEEVTYYLAVELMGKYANVILMDEDQKILDALTRIPPYQNTQRIIQPGAKYSTPEPQSKLDPFLAVSYDPTLSFTTQFAGFSPLLSQEFTYRLTNNQSFETIMQAVIASEQLFIYPIKQGYEYHVIPLTHLKQTPVAVLPLMQGLEFLYQKQETKNQIQEVTVDLSRIIKRELKKAENKIPKLLASLAEAKTAEKYKNYGDLLLTYAADLPTGLAVIELLDFEQKPINIPLDLKRNGIANANQYFKRYHKAKNALHHLKEQLSIAKQDLAYFQALSYQLAEASLLDAQEIRQELVNYGYLKPLKKNIHYKKGRLNYQVIPFNDTINFYLGKNNLQNDYLTFDWAKKHYYWFHVHDMSGTHLIVNTAELTEELIRTAAMLAAYFSQARASSSIAVDYTQVKHLKKIPNARLGLVRLTTYKTIYIDIDQAKVTQLIS